MRTIPRHLSLPLPAGERRVVCGYCGITWHRSDCYKDPAGYWTCPDDAGGRDQVTLDRENQQNALNAWVPRGPREPW